jgi:hypothetical protein
MTMRELRPWNVKPGMTVRVPAFPFEIFGRGYKDVSVRMVEPGRNFMSGEHCWTIYGPQEGYDDGRIGTYYRDERVRVVREAR